MAKTPAQIHAEEKTTAIAEGLAESERLHKENDSDTPETPKGPAQMSLEEVVTFAVKTVLADRRDMNKAISFIRIWYNAQPMGKDERKETARALVAMLDTLKLMSEDLYNNGVQISYQDRW